jgi:hypothetical protein
MTYRLLSETRPIARKAHKCIWCGESIPVGEQYLRAKVAGEGTVSDQAWHFECKDDCDETSLYDGDEFMPHSNERPEKALK